MYSAGVICSAAIVRSFGHWFPVARVASLSSSSRTAIAAANTTTVITKVAKKAPCTMLPVIRQHQPEQDDDQEDLDGLRPEHRPERLPGRLRASPRATIQP